MARTPNFQTREEDEHRSVNGVEAKAVIPYALQGGTTNPVPWGGGGLVPEAYDYIASNPGTTTDVYTYYSGGSSGTLVATLTLTYTDSSKGTLSSVART